MSEKQKITFTKYNEYKKIPDKKEVRVTKMNHIIEILSMDKEPKALQQYVKLDKYRYYHKGTGEIFEYKITDNRGQNIAGVKETQRKIRHLINNNFVGGLNELFITLTYAENMTDTRKLMKDFEMFMKKLKRKYLVEYISIVEPQGRGAWHCHVLIKDETAEKLYIHNDVIAQMWGHGFTTTRRLKEVDNIGAYLSAYLADLELCEENQDSIYEAMTFDGVKMTIEEKDVDENGKKVKKKFVKGARLHMYPSGMNIYRKSKGIKKPETLKMIYEDIKKEIGKIKPDFTTTTELNSPEQLINSITYEHYNRKRK
jgi:hypothetical protein